MKNLFGSLQQVGKALMLPVSVLPVAGILLGVGAAKFSVLPATLSSVMEQAGGAVFGNMALLFAIGVALGFTKNDGVAGLAAAVGYFILTKTVTVVAPLLAGLDPAAADFAAQADKVSNVGVLGGVIAGGIAAYMFNRFYRIQLPEYLGFFAGKRFVPLYWRCTCRCVMKTKPTSRRLPMRPSACLARWKAWCSIRKCNSSRASN